MNNFYTEKSQSPILSMFKAYEKKIKNPNKLCNFLILCVYMIIAHFNIKCVKIIPTHKKKGCKKNDTNERKHTEIE